LPEEEVVTSDVREDRWYVSVGHRAVGPVKLSLVARGVEAGRVPRTAFVRHEGWKVWRSLAELDCENPSVLEDAPPPGDDLAELAVLDGRDGSVAGLGWSEDELRDDLLILMTAAVARCGADAALVQVLIGKRAVVVGAHGPGGGKELIGAASSRATASLLGRLAGGLVGTRRIPVTVAGRVVAMLQVGRRSLFTEAEIDSLETLAGALAEKLAAIATPDA